MRKKKETAEMIEKKIDSTMDAINQVKAIDKKIDQTLNPPSGKALSKEPYDFMRYDGKNADDIEKTLQVSLTRPDAGEKGDTYVVCWDGHSHYETILEPTDYVVKLPRDGSVFVLTKEEFAERFEVL